MGCYKVLLMNKNSLWNGPLNSLYVYGPPVNVRGPFHQHGLALIPEWISNRIASKVWNKIAYPFSDFNVYPWKFGNG